LAGFSQTDIPGCSASEARPTGSAQHECIQIVVADGAGRAPGGELTARNDFVDLDIDRHGAAGRHQLDARANA